MSKGEKKLNKNRNKIAARDMKILERERVCYENEAHEYWKENKIQKLFICAHEHATS